MLDSDLPTVTDNSDINEYLDEVHDWFYKGSAVLRSANAILETIGSHKIRPRFHWPKLVLEWRDNVRFQRLVKRNSLHPNFSYKSGYHSVPSHYQTIVDNILATEKIIAPV